MNLGKLGEKKEDRLGKQGNEYEVQIPDEGLTGGFWSETCNRLKLDRKSELIGSLSYSVLGNLTDTIGGTTLDTASFLNSHVFSGN